MGSTIEAKYGTSNQTITITLASLGSTNSRASTYIDNTTNLFLDALVSISTKTGASGVSSTGTINVYAYGTVNVGATSTTFTDGASGSDSAITVVNARLIGIFNANANATEYFAGPFSVASAFGGDLPQQWGIIFNNASGATLDTTAGNHNVVYQGLLAQTTP